MKKIILIISLLIFNYPLIAQWSNNPAVNNTICDVDNAQLDPKISLASDGGCYMAWFDGRGDGELKVYIQRLDVNGVKQFGENGLLVSDKPQNSWIGDWDLKTDASGNAIVVFSDKRASTGTDTTVNPYAYKISPTGTFLWGADGVALTSETSRYQMWPKAAVLSDGSTAFVWWYFYPPTRTTWVKVQRLNSAGVPQYNPPVNIQSPDGKRYQYPNVVPSDNGSYIVSWVYGPKDTVGSFIPDNVSLMCNKYNSAGQPSLWAELPKIVYTNTGNTLPIYMVPQVIPDGMNGIIISYFHTGSSTFFSSIQRYSSGGTQMFANNGTLVATTTARGHIQAAVTVSTVTNDVYAFWTELDPPTTQSHQAVYGQRINNLGVRQWGDNGLAYTTLDTVGIFEIDCHAKDTNVVVTYMTEILGPQLDQYRAFRVGQSGSKNWGNNGVSTVNSLKSYANTVMNSSGMTMCVWQDSRNTHGGVFAQNVKYDGTLGPIGIKQISSNVPDRFNLMQNYPNPFNPMTKIKFDVSKTSFVTLNIYDNLGRFIKTIVSQNLSAGSYEADFNATGLASGVYFYQLRTENFIQTKMMMLVK
ncbi:MAG TPA: T9SS type A sorting domain-containing protein [Ignavibacteria bacterium]|nr:T9SS type A sorting domain-containing protein [Ignavibacteria bacterium]